MDVISVGRPHCMHVTILKIRSDQLAKVNVLIEKVVYFLRKMQTSSLIRSTVEDRKSKIKKKYSGERLRGFDPAPQPCRHPQLSANGGNLSEWRGNPLSQSGCS